MEFLGQDTSPRPFHPRRTLFVLTVLILFTVVYYVRRPPASPYLELRGEAMGTTWSVKVSESPLDKVEAQRLFREISARLEEINQALSTYIPGSEISRFNASPSTAPFSVSEDFVAVLRRALEICEATGGALDPTILPLVKLWGFQGDAPPKPPADDQLQEVMQTVGYRQLEVLSDSSIRKKAPAVSIGLDAVAKGYAVDQVAQILLAGGLTNLYAEIGGELVTRGVNAEGGPWRIGIERPDRSAVRTGSLSAIVQLTDAALATSGDYRHFYQAEDGLFYAHILDPRTGCPTRHRLASVSVVAEDAMTADAVATALFVMGEEKGMDWIQGYPDAEAYFLVRRDDGTYEEWASAGFPDVTAVGD